MDDQTLPSGYPIKKRPMTSLNSVQYLNTPGYLTASTSCSNLDAVKKDHDDHLMVVQSIERSTMEALQGINPLALPVPLTASSEGKCATYTNLYRNKLQ